MLLHLIYLCIITHHYILSKTAFSHTKTVFIYIDIYIYILTSINIYEFFK